MELFINIKKSDLLKLFFLMIIPIIIVDSIIAYAESETQILPTDNGTLDIRLSYDDPVLGETITLRTDFINPQTQQIQEHIDWWFKVSKEEQVIWGPTQLSHTSEGSLKNLKYEFKEDGKYVLEFGVEGILFQPIPLETVKFDVVVGEVLSSEPVKRIPEWVDNTMQWYLDGLISEDEMISAIQFLVNEGIIILD